MKILLIIQLPPALWALFGVIIGALLTGIINFLLQKSQFKHNKEMYYLQNQSREQVKEIILDLLNHRSFTDRSFEAIHKRIGGYSEDAIRQMLHEVGAIPSSRKDGLGEWWYLKERAQERIDKKKNA
jgi:hypothetical protein